MESSWFVDVNDVYGVFSRNNESRHSLRKHPEINRNVRQNTVSVLKHSFQHQVTLVAIFFTFCNEYDHNFINHHLSFIRLPFVAQCNSIGANFINKFARVNFFME